MGNLTSTSKHTTAHSHNFTPDTEVLNGTTLVPHYGDVKVVRDKKTSQIMFMKEVVVNTKQAYEQELIICSNRIALKHPNVVNIIGYTSEDKQNFCATSFKISVFIELLEKNLLADFENRKTEQRFYSENELLLIAENLISALSYFQTQGYSHGDIRLVNIFAKDNNYKLSDPSLSAQRGSNGLTLAIIQSVETLLAPELLSQVPEEQIEFKANPYKADVFSLGATLLALATLTHSENLYNYKTGTLDNFLLEERLIVVRSRYSAVTYEMIRSMLTLDPASRPDFVSLSERLLPFKEEIRNCRPLPFVRLETTPTPGQFGTITSAPTEDLDEKIRNAIERSQATVKTITGKEGVSYSTPARTDLQAASYPTGISPYEQGYTTATPTIEHQSYRTPGGGVYYTTPVGGEGTYPYVTSNVAGDYTSPTYDPVAYKMSSPQTYEVTSSYLASEKEKQAVMPEYYTTSTYYGAPTITYSYPTAQGENVLTSPSKNYYGESGQIIGTTYYNPSYPVETGVAQSYPATGYAGVEVSQPLSYTQQPQADVYYSEMQNLVDTYKDVQISTPIEQLTNIGTALPQEYLEDQPVITSEPLLQENQPAFSQGQARSQISPLRSKPTGFSQESPSRGHQGMTGQLSKEQQESKLVQEIVSAGTEEIAQP